MATESVKGVLSAVVPEPGRPLYETTRDVLLKAIETGQFSPEQRLPSTKELSKQMSVSLVTAHRALRELVEAGVLDRTQRRGTFIADGRGRSNRKVPLALLLHREASLADFYHGQLLEGFHQASNDQGVELTFVHYGEPISKRRQGCLLVNPLPEELEQVIEGVDDRPLVVVGARSHLPGVPSVDVDNLAIATLAVEHLHSLGHRRIGYVGNEPRLSNSRDRWEGFRDNMKRLGLPIDERHVIHAEGTRLTQREKMHLHRVLRTPDRPSALFAGGYYYALDIYDASLMLGLKVPQDLSVIGVDNPTSAAHLSPPLTTLQQPLVELGQVAVTTLLDALRAADQPRQDQLLQPELMIRRSSAPLTS